MLNFEEYKEIPDLPILISEKNKKEIYEKDYHSDMGQHFERVNTRLKEFDLKNIQLPHIVNSSQKSAFESSLTILETMTKSLGGKIYSEINYENFNAFIVVTLPNFDFYEDGTIEYLRTVSTSAKQITFHNLGKNEINMTVQFNYFKRIRDEVELEDSDLKQNDK